MLHCFETELSDRGHFVCIVDIGGILYDIWHAKEVTSESDETNSTNADQLVRIANRNGWEHEVYTQEYSLDVTEVFDPKSAEGNLLLDFLTQKMNFRETTDQQLVEETLALIRDLSFDKDGKRIGEIKTALVVINKNRK